MKGKNQMTVQMTKNFVIQSVQQTCNLKYTYFNGLLILFRKKAKLHIVQRFQTNSRVYLAIEEEINRTSIKGQLYLIYTLLKQGNIGGSQW